MQEKEKIANEKFNLNFKIVWYVHVVHKVTLGRIGGLVFTWGRLKEEKKESEMQLKYYPGQNIVWTILWFEIQDKN